MDEFQAEPVQQSLLSWMVNALGFPYFILIPAAGLLAFLLALLIVFKGNGPMASVALVLVVHVPLLIGVFAALQGGIAAYTVIAMSAATPKPSEVPAGIPAALVAPFVGMLMMAPGYAVAALGALIRCIAAGTDRGK